MTRLVRVGIPAVFLALSLCVQALASTLTSGSSLARLEPARLFNPGSESLFAGLSGPPRQFSPLVIALFNVATLPELSLSAPFSAMNDAIGTGVASVNFGIPRLQVSYAHYPLPAGPVTVPVVRPAAAPASLAAPRPVPAAEVAQGAALRTAPPAAPVIESSTVRFGRYAPYTPSITGLVTGVSVPGRLGGMHFQTAFHAMQLCGTADEGAACASSGDAAAAQSFSAGTDFNVRTGNSALRLGLSSSVEHLNNGTSGMFPYVPLDPDAQAGLTYFGLTNVVSQSVGAHVAVPVNRQLTVGLQYDRAHYQGDYGNTLLPGFGASKDTYLGNITYQLPNTSSAITLSARQYRYQDAFAPNFNLTQTRADLNFSVKF